jgi:serine/threonine-protein kinase
VTDQLDRLHDALHGRYTIDRELGRGGMAIVYLGHDPRHDRRVAIKVLRPEIMVGVGADRFLREIRIAARLSHPHILPLFDSGDLPGESGEPRGHLYYVMPYVEGESLRDRLAREQRLPIADAVRIGAEVASGLAYAHAQGVIHRDVKPENILLTGGSAVLTDFGIAHAVDLAGGRLTGTGVVVGSPAYMSPEQASGIADARTDVYALGCVLYEMLGGTPPFSGPTTIALLASHTLKPVPSLRQSREAIPRHLEALVLKALAKDPADRFATAAELALALTQVPAAGDTTASTLVATPAPSRSIAVLPFVDLSPARDQEYFCDGIAEELRATLSQLGGLRVASRTSVVGWKGKAGDIRAIGKDLGVTHVLEGTVRSGPDRLRVTVTLTGTEDGFQLWTERYDRQSADVFAIQDDIARRVAEALRVHLTVERPVRRPGTTNVEAYRAYLRGRHHWNRRTERSLRQSVIHMEEAIAADPEYPQAHAGLADSYATLGVYGALAPGDAMPRALAAADRALAIDPALADALVVRGAVRALYQWRWRDAETEFHEAIRQDPRYPTGHHWFASTVLMPLGRFEEAARAIDQALELDPRSPAISLTRGLLLALRGDDRGAIEQYERLLDQDPEFSVAHLFLSQVLERQGRFGEAIGALEQAATFGGESPEVLAMLAHTRARAGDTGEANRLEERLAALGSNRYVSPVLRAQARLGHGDRAGALDLLEEAVGVRAAELVWTGVRWIYDPLRDSPRFQAVLRTVGLVA